MEIVRYSLSEYDLSMNGNISCRTKIWTDAELESSILFEVNKENNLDVEEKSPGKLYRYLWTELLITIIQPKMRIITI